MKSKDEILAVLFPYPNSLSTCVADAGTETICHHYLDVVITSVIDSPEEDDEELRALNGHVSAFESELETYFSALQSIENKTTLLHVMAAVPEENCLQVFLTKASEQSPECQSNIKQLFNAKNERGQTFLHLFASSYEGALEDTYSWLNNIFEHEFFMHDDGFRPKLYNERDHEGKIPLEYALMNRDIFNEADATTNSYLNYSFVNDALFHTLDHNLNSIPPLLLALLFSNKDGIFYSPEGSEAVAVERAIHFLNKIENRHEVYQLCTEEGQAFINDITMESPSLKKRRIAGDSKDRAASSGCFSSAEPSQSSTTPSGSSSATELERPGNLVASESIRARKTNPRFSWSLGSFNVLPLCRQPLNGAGQPPLSTGNSGNIFSRDFYQFPRK